MEDTRLIHVQSVHRARLHSQGPQGLTGVMEFVNGLMDDVKKIYLSKNLLVNDSKKHFSHQIVWWICKLTIRQLITLTCQIIVQQILLFFEEINTYTTLLKVPFFQKIQRGSKNMQITILNLNFWN